mgnify:CR=1 FL=1
MTPKQLGSFGESLAYKKLLSSGYQILERNYRFSKAEVDLIVKKDDILIFVEVKTRSSSYFGQPEEFVSQNQEQLLFDAANHYMEQIGHDWEIRFDIISILYRNKNNYQLKHLKDAFFPDQI